MFQRLARRGEQIAAARNAARRERIAARLGEAMPGLEVSSEGGAVMLRGVGLARRYDRSADLRWRLAEACDER